MSVCVSVSMSNKSDIQALQISVHVGRGHGSVIDGVTIHHVLSVS